MEAVDTPESCEDDVESLRQDAEELRRARLLLERAEEMAGIGSWEFDYATKTVVGSPGAHKIYGAPSSGLRVEDMELVPLPEYRALLNKARDDHIRNGLPYDVEFKIKRMSDGTILDVHSRASWDATHRRLFGIIRDITKERLADEEIRSLNRELEARVEERTRQLVAANAALASALAELEVQHGKQVVAEKMEAIGRLVATLAHELNTPIGAIKSESESGLRDAADIVERLERLRSLDDGDFATLRALVQGADPMKAVSITNVQQRRVKRRSLEAALVEAGIRDAGLAADELADMGFDGPMEELLAPRRGLPIAEIVHLAWEFTSDARADAVMREASEKAERVVRTMRSNVSGGRGQRIVRVDLRSTIEAALSFQRRVAGTGVTIECSWGAAAEVDCIPEQLEQVWSNLVSNAFHAMGHSGKLRIETEREGMTALVRVIDDGTGIAEEMRERVFTPFFTTKAPGMGTGLGLDISRRTLEEIGGRIDFESRPGRTCFTVHLPAVS
jgi:signal transduction histidine kinase